ncbi:uncharacterized protein LOC141569602 [Rhinolophus sinicus]|uniref:uncharacterized protein LOC141569602 n=1 Tax=Rhinolophus sinicus TaxID=89399 RepID=UPI003D797AA0
MATKAMAAVERARPLRAHTLPCRASGASQSSQARRRPLSNTPSRIVAEFSLPTPPSKWQHPLLGTPSNQFPAAGAEPPPSCPPFSSPLNDIYIAKMGPAGLQPSPSWQASRPRADPGLLAASQATERVFYNPGCLRSAPPLSLGAAGLLAGPDCGLLGVCTAPRAPPPRLERKGASRPAPRCGNAPDSPDPGAGLGDGSSYTYFINPLN